MQFIPSVRIFGSGNMAWNLSIALNNWGYQIEQIISRNPQTGNELAKLCSAEYTNQFKGCINFKGIVLFCLSDTALQEIAPQLHFPRALVLHTSGSQPLSLLKNCSTYCAVVYPLMTFTRELPVKVFEAPIFVELENRLVRLAVLEFAKSLSAKVKIVNESQRAHLHLAGVIANNFTNYLFGLAGDIVADQGLSPDVLLPLIHRTIKKLKLASAHENQTGPAKRNDTVVIEKNLALLAVQPLIQDLYRIVTKGIQEKTSSKLL